MLAAWVSLSALWLLAVVRASHDDCGPNLVQLIIRSTEPCKLRVTRDDVDASDAELRQQVAAGLGRGQALAESVKEHEARAAQWFQLRLFTPEYHHYLTNQASDSERRQVMDTLEDLANATALGSHLAQQFNIDPQLIGDFLTSIRVPADPAHVLQTPTCNASDIYRTYDGSCNNLQHPTYGMTQSPFTRLLKPVFHDGINVPKKSVTGKDLPNARVLRKDLMPTGEFNDKTNTLMVMQFGQLIAHDTSLSADWLGSNGIGIECCSRNATPLPCKDISIGCYPVKIPEDDKYYSARGVTCMSLARSMKMYTHGGYIGPANTMNAVNHYLDTSFTYGFDSDRARQLREFTGGHLRGQILPDGRKVLPQEDNPMISCSLAQNETCFFAGDGRVNQNTQLSVLHIDWFREHNRVADVLSSINRHWDDEKIFQEARRIINAEYQHIVYNEFLPQILYPGWLKKYNLKPSRTGYSDCYNESINPATFAEFTEAVYRGFHGIAQSDLIMFKDIGCPVGKIKIGQWMDRPEIIVQDGNLDQFTLGLTQQPSTKDDKYTVRELNRNLFRVDGDYGQDLDMFDIVRGRDNGLGSYNDYRELVGQPRIKNFKDFIHLTSYEDALALEQLYEDPDDVELMVMVLLERRDPHKMAVRDIILLDQFYRWKCGDRHFYEYSGSPHPFKTGQLNEIKKVTMARILCDNSDHVTRLQPNCFKKVSDTNKPTDCKLLPVVDLSYWKEEN